MILMLLNFDKIHFLTGNKDLLLNVSNVPVHSTWNERVIQFLGAFSRNLLKDPRTKGFVDITSYTFWIRNASLRQIKEHYYPHTEDKIGRGVAFHIAPSNVPVNFAVSFTSSLLAGNINIVRVSNKNFEQVVIIVDSLKKTFEEGFNEFEQYLIIIRYEHDDEITQYLSSLCDIRIVWGGDRTISAVRTAQLPPRTIEMTFADRHSIALLNSDAVMEADIRKLAADFYTDTYYIDQNACSSPRIVVWFGGKIELAKKRFWSEVEALVKKDYGFKEIQAIDKFNMFCRLAAVNKNIKLENNSNLVMRIKVELLGSELMKYKFGGGYFFEYEAKELADILPLMDKACQTISYFGMDGQEIQQLIIADGVRGGDRIVPVGKTLDLTFKWDGYDMIENMSRYVYRPEYLS